MCYIIEFTNNFKPGQTVAIMVKTLPHISVKELNVYVTAQYDFLGVAHGGWLDNWPLKINIPLGTTQIPKIICQHFEQRPLKCKKDPDYVSVQQCLVDKFISKEFSPCSHKVKETSSLAYNPLLFLN